MRGADQVLHPPGHPMAREERRDRLGSVAAGIDGDGDDLHVRGLGGTHQFQGRVQARR